MANEQWRSSKFFIFLNFSLDKIKDLTKNKSMTKKEENGKKKTEISSEEDADDDLIEELPTKKTNLKDKNQRVSVSAEAYGNFNKKGNYKPRVVPKSDEQKKRIRERLQKAFMFQALEEKEAEIVINAMEEKIFK